MFPLPKLLLEKNADHMYSLLTENLILNVKLHSSDYKSTYLSVLYH